MAKVLIPLPHRDFDPSEVAISWSVLKRLGHSVAFATPGGQPGRADDMMLTGEGLDIWGFLPGLKRLVAIGRLMRANSGARNAYAAMEQDPEFKSPLSWRQVRRAGRAGLPRRSACRAKPRRRRPLGALWPAHHRAHLDVRAQSRAGRTCRSLLGSGLLSNVPR